MKTPTDWEGPVFLLNFPLSVSNVCANNVYMNPVKQGSYDLVRAGEQWLSLYRELAKDALVYVLPGHDNLQDLPFVANLGCYLPHIKDRNVIILSKFTSEPRVGEELIGYRFFKSFDYEVHFAPHCWEGEAELKWVRDNIYLGATGCRSTKEVYVWMEEQFGMKIPTIELIDPKLYHLDCVYFQLTDQKAIVNTSAITYQCLRKLENLVDIVDVPSICVYEGWTNVVRLGETIFHSPATDYWKLFNKLLYRHGFELRIIDLSEFDKSGADLSCLCMHLNYKNR